MLKADLHCHSTASDGLLSPEAVARRAAENGVELFSLADHDDLGGLSVAASVAGELGMRFVTGVEISIEWNKAQIHILGYNFDPGNAALNAALASIREGRLLRARRMSDDLEKKLKLRECFAGALRFATNPNLISRAHFARYLVELGLYKEVRNVFESCLIPGRPGYVDHQWASLEAAVGWILGAGGIASVAHPGRYKLSRKQMREFFGEFKALGGRAIEVVSGSHSADNVLTFGRLAHEFGFMASCGSDFHGPGESYIDLGRIDPLPAGLTPIWEAF